MSKMVLELGGSYTAGQAFSKAQQDVKNFGRANKDAIKAGTDSLKELEKGFGEDLGKSVGTAKGIIQGLAQGGLWGAIGAAAGAAIGLVVDWFRQAKENAKALADTCGEFVSAAIKKVGEDFSATQQEIAKAKVEAQDFAQIAKGAIVQSANAKIHNLHIETLQKITDNMTESGRKVVLADEALQAAKMKQAMVSEMNAANIAEQQGRINLANETLVAAQNRLAQIEAEKCNLSVHENEVLKRYSELRGQLEEVTIKYKENMITSNEAARRSADVQKELTEIYETNKGTIDGNKAVLEALDAAQKTVTEAEIQYEHEERALTLVKQQNAEAERQAERAILDATQAKKLVEQADLEYNEKQKEAGDKIKEAAEKHYQKVQERIEAEELSEAELNELRRGRAEVEKECIRLGINSARYIEIYTNSIKEGAEHNEAMDAVRHAWEKATEEEKKITEVCTKYKVDAKEYIKKFNEMTEKGISETDAYTQLQRDLNDELKERTDAEKKATDAARKNGGLGGNNNSASAAVSVSLDSGEASNIANEVEQKQGFKNEQRRLRNEMRRARDAKNNTKIDEPKMVRALKGEMPAEEARQWMEYAKKTYTPDQMRELGRLAMNTELLSKREQQRQLSAIEQMAQEIAKSLTIK